MEAVARFDQNLVHFPLGQFAHQTGKIDLSLGVGNIEDLGAFFMQGSRFFRVARRSRDENRAAGTIRCKKANVRWYLSLDRADLPEGLKPGQSTYRSVLVDGREVEFSEGFTDLHTKSYEHILSGHGYGIEDVRPSIEVASAIRKLGLSDAGAGAHPFVKKARR